MTFRKPYTYVIDGEVHVQPEVTLTIENDVVVLVRNGKKQGRFLNRSALIFDASSWVYANTVYFKAADAQNRIVRRADNG